MRSLHFFYYRVTKACLMMSTFFTLAHLELIPLSLQEALLFAIVGHVSLKLFALFLGWADVDPSLYILKVHLCSTCTFIICDLWKPDLEN